jgi:hypothetical protein
MFATIKNGQFDKLLPEGQAFTLNGVQYPANWLNLSTPEEKSVLGIVDVVYEQQPNDQFYWVSQNAPTFVARTNTVDVTFTAVAKDIDQLKKQLTGQVNTGAHNALFMTDYMDSRKAHDPDYVAPADWIEWRTSVRAAAQTLKQEIAAAADVQALSEIVISFPANPDAVIPTEQ